MIKVFMICSGLGNINRGFESFTQECFEALSLYSDLEVKLFKGGSEMYDLGKTLWNLPRHHLLTQHISNLTRKVNPKISPKFIEEFSFFLSLIPDLQRFKPQVIYFSQSQLGTLLWHWRNLTKQPYKLLFRNGGPAGDFDNLKYRWDHIQQLAPFHLQTALDQGVSPEKQTLVPNAVHIPAQLLSLSIEERKSLRHQLGLPEDQTILLSVAAINRSHKRLDYLIRELAKVKERPYLLMLGQPEKESDEIIKLANQLLGNQNFQIRNVKSQKVKNYYKVADIFVLASLTEGFGRVYVEAMSYGLPCIAHDSSHTRYILGDEGYLGDLKMSGSLEKLLSKAFKEIDNISLRRKRHKWVYEHFSWDKIIPDYIRLIENCIATQ